MKTFCNLQRQVLKIVAKIFNQNMKISLLSLICVLFLFESVFSQNVLVQRYRLAESYEKGGNLEGALSIYEDLYKEKPEDDTYFFALVRVLKQMSKYTELLKYTEDKFSRKQSPEIMVLLAEMNWRAGNSKKADELWKTIIDKHGVNTQIYELLASSQIELRLFDKAISTYLSARRKFDDKQIFSENLIRLYISTANYVDGTEEILNLLDINFNIALAQGRLFAFMSNEEAFDHIEKVLKRRSDSNKSNIFYQEVYAWFLRTSNRLEQALELTVRIDDIKQSKGLDILNFANSTSRDGDFDIAMKAFSILIERGKNSPYASSALYGYTRSLEGKMASDKSKKFSERELKDIINRYEAIIKEYPKSTHAAESILRLAQIYSEFLNNYERSIDEYKRLIKEFPNNAFSAEAGIELAKVYLMRDDIENATKTLEQISKSRFSDNKAKDYANLIFADIEYYKGNIEKAKELYKSLTMNPDSDIANDAIRKYAFIVENENFINPIQIFSKAEYAELRKDYKKALEHYSEVSVISSSDNLAELALLRMAGIQFRENQYDLSRKNAQKLLTDFPESIYADRMTKLIADTYFEEKNIPEAIRFYTEILVKYPGSIYLHEARARIRLLRQENI